MKAYLFLLPLIVLISTEVYPQDQKWEVYIGINGRYEEAKSVLEYYDKGYYVEGSYLISGHLYGWQIKTDVNGVELWDKTLQHNMYQMGGRKSAIDSEGNRYVAGTKFAGKSMPFIAKFDPCGENLWCKILNDPQFNSGGAWDIVINENDEIVVLCNVISSNLKVQIYLACLDKDGEYLWKQQYAAKENHPWIATPVAYQLMQHNSEYFISGYCYWPYPTDTNHVFLRPLFIGIDSLFNEKWILPFAPLDSVFGDAYSSIPLNDSIILGVGERWLEGYNMNSLLMLFSITGQELGYSQIHNNAIGSNLDFNYIRRIEVLDDSLFISPSYYGIAGNIHFGELVYNAYSLLYNYSIRGVCSGISSITKTYNKNFVIANSVKKPNNDQDIYLYKIDENLESVPFDNTPYVYDSLCPTPIQSGIIDLTSCMVWTGTEEVPSPQQYYASIAQIPLTAYPNPAETEITLAFQNTEHHNNMLLECYNLFGQRVHSEKVYKGQQKTKLSIEQWQSGLYIAVVKSDGRVAGQVRFVRR